MRPSRWATSVSSAVGALEVIPFRSAATSTFWILELPITCEVNVLTGGLLPFNHNPSL